VRRALDDGPRLAARVREARSRSETARVLREASGTALAWLQWLDDGGVQERLSWYVGEGRGAAPALRGDDLIALGVPRGPAVSDMLHTLRDEHLDGRLVDRQAEIDYVRSLTTRDERKG
jgi:hypothetical protein